MIVSAAEKSFVFGASPVCCQQHVCGEPKKMFIINKNYIIMIIHENHMDKMKRMKKIFAARSDPCLI